MENQSTSETSYSLYYIFAAVIMALTSWIYVGSVFSLFAGALLGFIFAGFFVNALVKNRGEY